MAKVRLFNTSGEEVGEVTVPTSPYPQIVRWQGMFYALQNGRYVLATLYEAF